MCGGLFLLRKAGTRRAAVCVLGLLTGFAWCRGYEALFLRPLERYAGQELPFASEALAAPQQTTYGQSCEVRLKLGGQSCTAVLYFDEADADIRPGDTVLVTRLGQTYRTVAGKPERQPSHNNIPLTLVEDTV